MDNLTRMALDLLIDAAKTIVLEKMTKDYRRREKEYLDWCEMTNGEIDYEFSCAEDYYAWGRIKDAFDTAVHPEILKINIDAIEQNNNELYEYGCWHPVVTETKTHGWDQYELQYKWEYWDYLRWCEETAKLYEEWERKKASNELIWKKLLNVSRALGFTYKAYMIFKVVIDNTNDIWAMAMPIDNETHDPHTYYIDPKTKEVLIESRFRYRFGRNYHIEL